MSFGEKVREDHAKCEKLDRFETDVFFFEEYTSS